MTKKNILLLKGGNGSEHDVSIISAQYIKDCLQKHSKYTVIDVEISKNSEWLYLGQPCHLSSNKKLKTSQSNKTLFEIDYCVPCFHGFPGETGEIQGLLKLMGIAYFGNHLEASILCFNKISTKLWLEKFNIPTTPFIFINEFSEMNLTRVKEFFIKNKTIFVKAANQGSSVGCYPVKQVEFLEDTLKKAFQYSDNILIEKELKARELEVSVFSYNGVIHASEPGEIICPDGFYDYSEKYSAKSNTQTEVEAKNLTKQQIQEIKKYSTQAFKALNLKDLSRIDFFLTDDNQIYLNEINTFPGLTPISMFPKMMENTGVLFSDFLDNCINKQLSND
ncbi:MAG: D-alanine-D-alanine ligase [Thermoproteota archaeon]|jgi:D-alanine-D-alanine ligase